MKEINVVVNQEPGRISWNFEEIKKRLEDELEVYRNTAYTDDTIKDAKGDVADLRKLAKAIKDRRKELKEKCLEPYAAIEVQAKELVDLIEKPIQAINNQVKDYEKRRKEKARAEIDGYWTQKAAELPEDIREKARVQIYDERWENATATKKSWKEGIENGIQKILDEISTIKSFSSEFEEDMLAVYKDDLSLQKAIAKMNELKAQKERVLEIERRKQEAEKRRQEEERQHRDKLEAQKAQEAQQQSAVPQIPKEALTMARPSAVLGDEISVGNVSQPQTYQGMEHAPSFAGEGDVSSNQEQREMRQHLEPVTKAYPNGKIRTVRILGTEEQITKILNYIQFTGATYEEV